MNKIEKKNSAVLIGSSVISRAGDILFDFASNSFLAGSNLNSLTLVGLYQIVENITSIIFNLFGGVIADRFRRKKILILTDFFSGIACISLSFIGAEAWLVYAIIGADILLSILSSFSGPAYKAITKESFERDNIAGVNSYLQTASMIVKIGMPIVSVGVYRLIGIHGAFLLDGISFIIASVIVLFISPIMEEIKQRENFSLTMIFKDLRSGFDYLFRKKSIFILIILSTFVNFFLAAYNLTLPYGSQMFPKVTGNIYGTFLAAEAVGGIVGAFLSGKVNKELSISKLMIYLGLSGVLLGSTPLIYNAFPFLLVIAISPAIFNLFLAIFNVQFFSFVQRDVESEFLGRVFGIIFTVAILFMPIGTTLFTVILRPNFEYNLSIVGLGIILLSIIFSFLYLKRDSK